MPDRPPQDSYNRDDLQKPGRPPRTAYEPKGSEGSTRSKKTATDPASGEPTGGGRRPPRSRSDETPRRR